METFKKITYLVLLICIIVYSMIFILNTLHIANITFTNEMTYSLILCVYTLLSIQISNISK